MYLLHNSIMEGAYQKRRLISVFVVLIALAFVVVTNTPLQIKVFNGGSDDNTSKNSSDSAARVLEKLAIKGRAPKTGYSREQFGNAWAIIDGCDMRNIILNRDLKNVIIDVNCKVTSGTLDDPYTGKTISFVRGNSSSDDVQIDHIVSLSDAWQKGAQLLTKEKRIEMANDPMELLAVDGPTNQQKGDGDAATWLPPNKSFRCQYVARQVAVKYKYNLWVTSAEHDAIKNILDKCPGQLLPSP